MTAVWWLEWRLALTNGRRFALGALAPLLIVLSLATGAAGPDTAAAAYLVVLVAFSVLGSSLPLRWDGERGLVERVVRGGVPAGRYLLARAGAGAAVDLVQLMPAFLLVVLVTDGSAGEISTALFALVISMWLAGLVGVVVAALTRSLAETALLAALTVLLLAHASGAFVDPRLRSTFAAIEAVSPFRILHEALLQLTTGASATGMGAALVWAILLPAGVGQLGTWIAAALGSVSRGGLEGV